MQLPAFEIQWLLIMTLGRMYLIVWNENITCECVHLCLHKLHAHIDLYWMQLWQNCVHKLMTIETMPLTHHSMEMHWWISELVYIFICFLYSFLHLSACTDEHRAHTHNSHFTSNVHEHMYRLKSALPQAIHWNACANLGVDESSAYMWMNVCNAQTGARGDAIARCP